MRVESGNYRDILRTFREDIDSLYVEEENTRFEKVCHPSGWYFYSNSVTEGGEIIKFHSVGGGESTVCGFWEFLKQTIFTKPNHKFQRAILDKRKANG